MKIKLTVCKEPVEVELCGMTMTISAENRAEVVVDIGEAEKPQEKPAEKAEKAAEPEEQPPFEEEVPPAQPEEQPPVAADTDSAPQVEANRLRPCYTEEQLHIARLFGIPLDDDTLEEDDGIFEDDE